MKTRFNALKRSGKIISGRVAAQGIFFLLVLLCTYKAGAQEKRLVYTVKKSGENVGKMHIVQKNSGQTVSYKLESEIKTRMIFTITARGTEEAVYDNGRLVYSFVYQNLNGQERVNKQIRLNGNRYIVTSKGTSSALGEASIGYNMICLYTNEPLQVRQVFSDKFQKLLTIQKIADHHYKVSFPDGNSNEYHYSNGTCTRIDVNNSLYDVVMELNQ